ncbi:PhzF family phenazine biosynthesis protein [Pasteurellaceae bacterium HPA106]|uniref:PhzF family phenazine biosynthesis protein n=1 Tax=Spirabiliibacterium pneumoniae TaxID=221400 RepID=UPI001AACD481|nr:PhzF family phenazine biosynthesis protein [Spirabiliibacterium pneumoniae]MBE2896981.1 PhzF family phenazine biosynthesis protein [Spirabiliibacterium pneumoniae]
MQTYAYVIVNVFATSHFGGNPLAVFPEAEGLDDATMQLIARQFNLSETVFVQQAESQSAVKKLAIFTPEYALPFAGHPTLGAAFVLHQRLNLPTQYQLETQAGLVEIVHQKAQVTFGLRNSICVTPSAISSAQMADMLGLVPDDIVGDVVNVNTGTAQTLVQLSSAKAVNACRIATALFLSHFACHALYVWHESQGEVISRLFFAQHGAVLEDPGTGSAAANLGGWAIKHQRTPLTWQIAQGDVINRPNRLSLTVDREHTIWVGGNVIEVANGTFFV